MRGVLLVLIMLRTLSQSSAPCPASCLVCSEDATICRKLSIIIGVPLTTRALMLTDGQISSVDSSVLSGLTNMTLLGLSNNAIENIPNNTFQNLQALKTLLLDHNKITTVSILDSTFSKLYSLETLQLGNNVLHDINGRWFQDTRSLLTLQLEGNLITQLESGTFSSSNLKNLETLDLSDNLITYIARDSFHSLPQLRSLDLSRNSLHSALDAFSSLFSLSTLNLVLNEWNCSCELLELSSFLRSYVQMAGKELYDSKQLVCHGAANSTIQNVLNLTQSNCMPPKESIAVRVPVKIENGISKQQYTRDISLAATLFFAGGVGVTICVIYTTCSKMDLRNEKETMRDKTSGEEGKVSTDSPSRRVHTTYEVPNSGHPFNNQEVLYPCNDAEGPRVLGNLGNMKPVDAIQSKVKINSDSDNKYSSYEGNFQDIQMLPDRLTIKCVHCAQTFEYWQRSKGERNITREVRTDRMANQQHREECVTQKLNAHGHMDSMKTHTYVEGAHHKRNSSLKPTQKRVGFDLTGSGGLKVQTQKEVKTHKIKTSYQSENLKLTLTPKMNTSAVRKGAKKLKVHSNSLLKVKINLNPFRKSKTNGKKNLNQEDLLSDFRDTYTHKTEKLRKKKSKKCLKKDPNKSRESTEIKKNSKKNKKDQLLQKDAKEDVLNPEDKKGEPNQPSPTSPNCLGDGTSAGLQTTEPQPNNPVTSATPTLLQEYMPSPDGSPSRKIRLILPEKTSNRPQTLLEKKIR